MISQIPIFMITNSRNSQRECCQKDTRPLSDFPKPPQVKVYRHAICKQLFQMAMKAC